MSGSADADPADADLAALWAFLARELGAVADPTLTPVDGGGSCEIFRIDWGPARYALRRAPRHASSATAHDVLREFRILDAIKDENVRIARPRLSCADPDVFGRPFYVMDYVEGFPIRAGVPPAWATAPETHGRALEEMVDALVAIHAVDWRRVGLDDGSRTHAPGYLGRQIDRWMAQLDSYQGRPMPLADQLTGWLTTNLPPDQPPALCHGDYKLDNLLYSPEPPPELLAVVDWEMASIGDPLVDLAWTMIFHPEPDATMRLGMAKEPTFDLRFVPSRATLVERYVTASGRDVSALAWYDVFARWKLAIALEGSHAKFVRGESSKPVHKFFGQQADLLLTSASELVERDADPEPDPDPD